MPSVCVRRLYGMGEPGTEPVSGQHMDTQDQGAQNDQHDAGGAVQNCRRGAVGKAGGNSCPQKRGSDAEDQA